MDLIAIEGLEKNFGAVKALRGLSLRVREGIFGLIGVNGAGKTTTIKILIGALNPDGGKASVLGYDCVKESLMIRQKIGVLHEKASFPRNTSGRDYLIFVAQLYGLSRDDAETQSRNVLKDVGLSAVERQSIGTYSAGMKQRLGLAQAFVGNPKLVILDEPTANLDPIGRADLLGTIRKLHVEKGVSFFISSHILPELQSVCDHIGIINNGVAVEHGEIQEIVQKHAGSVFKIIVSKPEAFLSLIRQSRFVEELHKAGDTIWIRASEPTLFHDYVMGIVQDKRLSLSLFQRGDLETAFKNIVGGNESD